MEPDEWDRATDWKELLRAVPAPINVRKMQLLIVAICRRVPADVTEPEVIECLDVVERFADGTDTKDAFECAINRLAYINYAMMFTDTIALQRGFR